MWRDGHAGQELWKATVSVAAGRLFQFGTLEQCLTDYKSAFASCAVWAAFARLNGPPNYHIKAIMEELFDSRDRWSDSVRTFHRAIWVGEHDLEVLRLSTLFPATPSSSSPILTLMQQKVSEAARLQSAAEKNTDAAVAEAEKTAAAKDFTQSLQSLHSVVVDGDVTQKPLCRPRCSRHEVLARGPQQGREELARCFFGRAVVCGCCTNQPHSGSHHRLDRRCEGIHGILLQKKKNARTSRFC